MKKNVILLILGMLALVTTDLWAQKNIPITIHGVIMDADSTSAIPYVNIQLKETHFGTVSDINGHFTITATEGDTLSFSCVGYFDAYFIMPNKMKGDTYTLVQLMRRETIMLEEVVIFPWPEYDQFKKAFLKMKPEKGISDIELQAAKEINIVSEDEYERNKYYYNVYYNNQLYDMTGIIPPNNFLNPLQWSNFIRDVTEKKYKKPKK